MSRKHVLEYDDIMNKQRGAVYGMRRGLLEGVEQRERVFAMAKGLVETVAVDRIPDKTRVDEWDLAGLESDILTRFGVTIDSSEFKTMNREEIEDTIFDLLKERYEQKEALIGPDYIRDAERIIMLNVIDNQWKDHLLSMDHLKEGIGMRAYGQKDPLLEYKKESFTLFQDMMDRIEDETLRYLYFMQVAEDDRPQMPFVRDPDDEEESYVPAGDPEPTPKPTPVDQKAARASIAEFTRKIEKKKEKELADLQFMGGSVSSAPQTPVVASKKVGRNDPCFCGSGKKYKKCHGINE